MSEADAHRLNDPKRDPTNLDYRTLALLFVCATRADLLATYLNGKDKPLEEEGSWQKLLDLGFARGILAESLYLFQDKDTQHALRQTQRVSQTLINLNDYCAAECPSDPILGQLVEYSMQQKEPLQEAGIEG